MNHRFVILFLFLLSLFSCKKSGSGIIETFSPELISSAPTNNETDVSIYTKEIVLIFNENITLKRGYEITLNGVTLSDVNPGVKNDLRIILPELQEGTIYTLIIPAYTIKGPTGAFIPAEIKLIFTTYKSPARTFSVEAQKVMDFLKQIYGIGTISGTMANINWNTDEADWVYAQTGKYPALNCFDFIHHVFSPSNWIDYSNISAVENWWQSNGLVAAMWHWNVPANSGISDQYAFYYGSKSDQTLFDVSKISDENSEEYRLMIKDIDIISGYLNILKSKGIPVIWRPLHEAAGAWFWWGAKGAAPFKSLWRLMFERMTNYHRLDNLIWVWTSEGNDPDWYPGDEYVDIVGRDLYQKTHIHDSQLTEFNKVKAIVLGRKMIALTECGGIPDPDLMFQKGDTWLWFMPWYGSYTRDDSLNGADYWRTVMNNSHVITRDQMPDLK
ncbi:glycosyl hydrolase [Anaerorudis cellulosivorans]|uniref:glycosyl hydrolase n=1 Tax=Anaerorudis cellulosivorans TaxID=3397862 RepID=UPI00221F7D84|nr:glycosyl hydrolase [Seramator thermalis]MCW1734421.1 glycosyl hydrolase [Seramator thermalis]